MRFIRICTFVLLFSKLTVFGQTIPSETSRITNSHASDTALFKLELKEANYDPRKNEFPYYTVSFPTSYDQSATPTLVIKKTRTVEEPHAGAIRKYFSKYLSNQFVLEQMPSLSKNENLNQYKVFPFRLNTLNQVEELISYDVNWQTYKNNNLAARGASSFVGASILATGTWYKIGVTQSGIHKLSKSFFNSIGINTNGLDPDKIRIYGNGGKMLPELNKAFRYDDLIENPIKVIDVENNGAFDNSDYVLFYATGPTEWIKTNSATGLKFKAVKNLYSDTSFYFINVDLGNGKRVVTKPSLSQANVASATYDYYNFHEENTVNFAKSGRAFYGEYFDITNSYTFSWTDGDFVTGDSLIAEVSLAAFYSLSSSYLVNGNGLNFAVNTSGILVSTYSEYAAASTATGWSLNPDNSEIRISIARQTSKSLGWLDKLTVNARRNLTVSNRQFLFRDSRSTGPGRICHFSIANSSSSPVQLWNVTDPLNPFIQDFSNGSALDFNAATDTLNEFCVAPANDFYTPVFVGKITNQNLHGLTQADYVIVTHPLFVKEAERLAAFHQQKEGLSYAIATTEQIYNEFSSGRQDIAGIRDFIRMLYSRNIGSGKEVKYVLLMGDGSYNNKNRSIVNNSNFIPTYQSHESLDPVRSITTDDFYGLMDPDEGYMVEDDATGKMDIGVGRFTCRNVNEVKTVIAKIENYYRKDPNFVVNNSTPENYSSANESPMGDWRNWLLFLGDDEDNALHMTQSNNLTNILKTIIPAYNYDKIFLDAYQRFSTPGGNRYPDASEDFLRRIHKGALIFNYTGHGGEVGLTAERMIDIDIINNLDNFNKLSLFITATCEFSRYDDPARTSAGELCLLNPKGGAIALFTTCRVAFADKNFTLNSELLKMLFKKLPSGKWPTLGDAVLLTKSHLPQNFYNANFHLLGDPAMMLAYPEQKVVTSKINNVPVTATSVDTLGALAKITVSGSVTDILGNKKTDFNGIVYPTVFDKEQSITCLMNSEDSGFKYYNSDTASLHPFQFNLQKNILYRGKILVTNGDFSFTFIVPKDISFAVGPGKISYYATNGLTDGNGYYDQVVVGGDSKNTLVDNEGPQINLFLNDKNFVNGGLTNEKPVLFADLADSSGINTLGTGIGHDISVIMDENSSKPLVLNDYYEASLNSYQSGRVKYPYNELSEGTHRLSFKAWDIQNNSNTVYADFIVAKSAELALNHVLNYPNPFTTRTKFMFQHNQGCNPLKVTVQVYTVSGKLVKTIQKSVSCEGSRPEGVEWDGRDDFGDKLGRGVYIYKLAILDVENKKAEKIEKLVILN
jgi:hypothetical protein